MTTKPDTDADRAIRDALDACVRKCAIGIDGTPLVDRPPRHVFALTSFAHLIELGHALVSLFDGNCRAGLGPTFRTALECYVHLKNQIDDPTYFLRLEAQHWREWRDALTSAEAGNPFLAEIAAAPELQQTKDLTHKRLRHFKRTGVRPLHQVKEAFNQAGMNHEYDSIYAFDSGHVHSGLGATFSLAVQIDGSEAKRLRLFSPDDGRFGQRLGTIASALIEVHPQVTGLVGIADRTDFTAEVAALHSSIVNRPNADE